MAQFNVKYDAQANAYVDRNTETEEGREAKRYARFRKNWKDNKRDIKAPFPKWMFSIEARANLI